MRRFLYGLGTYLGDPDLMIIRTIMIIIIIIRIKIMLLLLLLLLLLMIIMIIVGTYLGDPDLEASVDEHQTCCAIPICHDTGYCVTGH